MYDLSAKIIEAVKEEKKASMKRFLMIPLLLILFPGLACEQKQVITQLEVGRNKLLGAGLVLQAVEHLEKAEIQEGNKAEPRALLVIAYAQGLSTGMARAEKKEEQYKQQKKQRIAALNEAEMKVIFRVLNERHRVQNDARQILIDTGSKVVPLILDNLIKGRYANLQADFIKMLEEIGKEGVPQIIDTIRDRDASVNPRLTLIRLVGKIGDSSVISALESIRADSASSGLRMEIATTLYQLGKKGYRKEIVAGLANSDVRARRAAAKAMGSLNNPPTEELIKALADRDSRVCQHAAEALKKFPAKAAMLPLIDSLRGDGDNEAKQAVVFALEAHAAKGLGKGLSARLIEDLKSGRLANPKDRLRLVHLLKKEVIQNQIKMSPEDMNLEWKIWDYRQTKEDNDMVKDELDYLLTELGSR